MLNKKTKTSISKFISLILRHDPMSINESLDCHGWLSVDKMIKGINSQGRYNIELADVLDIVNTDEKQRYSIKTEKNVLYIRANQGHSVSVDMQFKPTSPPKTLYHGTSKDRYASIMLNGLKPMSRQYVHLTTEIESARKIGNRHGEPVVLKIDSEKMYDEGYRFFESDNHVWLTDYVNGKFIQRIE